MRAVNALGAVLGFRLAPFVVPAVERLHSACWTMMNAAARAPSFRSWRSPPTVRRASVPQATGLPGVVSCPSWHFEIGCVAFGSCRQNSRQSRLSDRSQSVVGRNGAVWFGSPVERVEVLHNSTSCAIRRAAEAMLEHGVNIVAVTDRGVPGRPVRSTRPCQTGRGRPLSSFSCTTPISRPSTVIRVPSRGSLGASSPHGLTKFRRTRTETKVGGAKQRP
jgi:hypothetical protein